MSFGSSCDLWKNNVSTSRCRSGQIPVPRAFSFYIQRRHTVGTAAFSQRALDVRTVASVTAAEHFFYSVSKSSTGEHL